MSDREQAIEIIEEDIAIHMRWRDYAHENPTCPSLKHAGNAERHQKWIDRLTLVLSVLRKS